MKTFGLVFLLTGILATACLAQLPDSLWSRAIGGLYPDECYSVQQTSEGGYILAGTTRSFGAGWYDFWLVKTNANGDSLWSHTFGGSDEDWCYSAQQTSDGGYILAGYTRSFGAGSADFWLVKTDGDGDSLWSRTFGGTDYDECRSVQETLDGGYILAGYTRSFGAGLADFWLVKTDVNGYSLWSRTFGGSSGDECHFVQQTSDEGYILAGVTASFGGASWDGWLVKTDADGDSLWSHAYGGGYYDEFNSVRQTWDGYILAGVTLSYGAGDYDFWLVKTYENGDSVWTRTFGGTGDDRCYSMAQTFDGNYILAGYTGSYGAGGNDFWLLRADDSGNRLWSRTFGGSNFDRAYSVQQTSDGACIVAGFTYSFGGGTPANDNFWLVKTGLPRPYNLTVYVNPAGADPILRWIMPEGGCVNIYGTTLMGQIGPPPAPGWVVLSTPCIPPGPVQWTDPDGVVPYKRYCVLMVHEETARSAAHRLTRQ